MTSFCLVLIALVLIISTVNAFLQSNIRIIQSRRNLFGNPSDANKSVPAKKDNGGGMFGGMGNIMDSVS